MPKVIGILDYDIIKTFLSNLDALDVKLSTLQRTRVYEQSFEDGTSDLTAYNCTQEVQDLEVFAGHYALKVTVSSGQSGYVETPRISISPYQMIKFSLVHKENEYVQSVKLVVIWRRIAGGEIERHEVTLTPFSEWIPEDVTLMSPKNTATMTIRFEITAKSGGNAIVYLDDIFMDRIGILMRQDSEGNVLVKDEGVINTVKPTLKASVFNQSVAANTNFFTSYLTPVSPPCTFRIYACFNASGVLSVVKRVGATQIVMQLNGGSNLSANCLYAFDIAVASGEEINFKYSVDATALDVKVLEIPASIS